MRSYFAFALVFTACTSAPPTGQATYKSVRDRLAKTPARLLIGGSQSSGTITASRYTHDGWFEGTTPLVIESGELVAHADHDGQVELAALQVSVDPIDIPNSVFGKPAQLRDVRVTLATRANAKTTWTSEDDATGNVMLSLDLSWSIAVNGGIAPLGTQHLPPISVDFALTGAGDHIDSTVSLRAMGELWSWAGLMKLTALQLELAAATVEP